MVLYILFMIALNISSPIFSASYIDTRDMSQESIKIQRLLGKLDVMKVQPQQTQDNGGKIALLTMITSGIAIAASSDNDYYYDHHYHDRPHLYSKYYHDKRYYRRYRKSDVGKVVGSAMATAGLVGLISSEAAKGQQKNQQKEIKKIEAEINSIISNLVVTDKDFNQENTELFKGLSRDTDRDVKKIALKLSNEIKTIKRSVEARKKEFVKLTNSLTTNFRYQEKITDESIMKNLEKMSYENISKSSVKKLKDLNKFLEKRIKKEEKIYNTTLKKEIKKFNDEIEEFQESTDQQILNITDTHNSQILAIVQVADEKVASLFQKYITKYIQKLAVY